MHYFLGMEVWQGDGDLFVSQGKYANEILKRFYMERSKPMETLLACNWRKEDATSGEVVETIVYRQLVGSVLYLVNTQPDMCYAVNQLSQPMTNKGSEASRIHRCRLGGSPPDRKSTSRGIFSIGSPTVSWYNKKWRSVALSLVEVEYMAASQATSEAIWMRKILVGLFGQQMDLTLIYCDNQSCIKLSENPVFHDWSKHIDIQYHHLRDCVLR
eukprot:PITA_16475